MSSPGEEEEDGWGKNVGGWSQGPVGGVADAHSLWAWRADGPVAPFSDMGLA